MQELSTVFDGHIRMKEGEEFHMLKLVEGALSFCVKTPQSVIYA